MKVKLEIRKIARHKPRFTRQQSYHKKFKDDKWRYPRGKSSKVRTKRSGHKLPPSIGYGSNSKFKHLNKFGLKEVIISNHAQLHGLKPGKHAVLLSSKLGIRKKLMLLEKIKSLGLHVMNIHDIDEYAKNIINMMKKKKETKHAMTKKKKEAKQPAKKEPEQAKELSAEEREKEVKEEQRKVLERKE